MITKSQQASDLWNSGQKKNALRIFKTFKMNLTKDEKETLTTTFEMDNDIEAKGTSMYEQFGYVLNDLWDKTEYIIENKLLVKHG